MRGALTALFASILLAMLAVTIYASSVRSVLDNGHLMRDPWFIATLCDAYFGFITFYVWVAYKESGWLARIVWLVLLLGLGNIAMAVYVLWQLYRLPPGAPLEHLLVARSGAAGAGAPMRG